MAKLSGPRPGGELLVLRGAARCLPGVAADAAAAARTRTDPSYHHHALSPRQRLYALPPRVGLKTDGNILLQIRSVFYFYSSVSVFVGFYIHIYRSRNEVSPSVFEESRFYMELTHIYSVFHPIFNLHKICLKIDMFKNIPITKYIC